MASISQQWWRLGGAAAIMFVVLFVIGTFVLQFDVPMYDDPVDDIRSYWVDDGQQFLVGNYIAAVGFAFFFLPFIVSFRVLLGRAEGGVNLWTRTSFIAAVIMTVWGAVATAFWSTLAYSDFADSASDETLTLLMNLDTSAYSLLPLAFAVFVLAASFVILQAGVLWRWLGYLGVIETVLCLIAPLSILSDKSDSALAIVWYAAFTGILIWVLLVGIAMFMLKEEPAAA